MTPHVPNVNRLTEAQLDAALSSHEDVILPSSGFTGSVMTAIRHEGGAPAPIAFPWKRAIPGFFAAAGALAFLIAMLVAMFRFRAAAAVSETSARPVLDALSLTTIAHHTMYSDGFWIAASIATPLLVLLLMRRLLFAR
jgi:hypothetical protein